MGLRAGDGGTEGRKAGTERPESSHTDPSRGQRSTGDILTGSVLSRDEVGSGGPRNADGVLGQLHQEGNWHWTPHPDHYEIFASLLI